MEGARILVILADETRTERLRALKDYRKSPAVFTPQTDKATRRRRVPRERLSRS